MHRSFAARDIRTAIPLLLEVHANMPNWIHFATDDAKSFPALMRWMVFDPDSPMRRKWELHPPTNYVVIEWRTPDGDWAQSLTEYVGGRAAQPRQMQPRLGVYDKHGNREGRIRFRLTYTWRPPGSSLGR